MASMPQARPAVLVVDDEGLVTGFLHDLLAGRGFAVATADSAAAALAELTARPFDLVVADRFLGDGGGADLVRAVRQASPATRVVIVTAYGSIAAAVETLRAGAADYILKPVDDASRFVARLEAALALPLHDGAAFEGVAAADLPADPAEALAALRARLAAARVATPPVAMVGSGS